LLPAARKTALSTNLDLKALDRLSASPAGIRSVSTDRRVAAGLRPARSAAASSPRSTSGTWHSPAGALFVAFSPHGELRETIKGRLVAEVVKRLFRDADTAPGEIGTIGRIVCAEGL